MSKLEELKKELKELERKEFMVQMIDHWTSEDSRYANELWEQIKAKRKEIEEYGKASI